MWKYGTSFCDVTVTLILQEKIGNIVFLKMHIFFWLKININHFYPKIPTGAQISTQRPTLKYMLWVFKRTKSMGVSVGFTD